MKTLDQITIEILNNYANEKSVSTGMQISAQELTKSFDINDLIEITNKMQDELDKTKKLCEELIKQTYPTLSVESVNLLVDEYFRIKNYSLNDYDYREKIYKETFLPNIIRRDDLIKQYEIHGADKFIKYNPLGV